MISTHKGVAVDQDYSWKPLHTCPLRVKVQLLTEQGVAVYGMYRPGATGFIAWAPLPNKPVPAEAATEVGIDNGFKQVDLRLVRLAAFILGAALVICPIAMILYLSSVAK